ncbi:adenine phosphoribosyltransferase [Nanchangia anserum]|uniref:Adenine phosphoribosyltransferase n=1 Tax=Nanchangia anserum TaxID=2692125 RepID=A0A8I0GBZ9_9ACTO|nr:adenine phosphoribosyltransferase [Nanchangia anserum]MBD3688758.1 adenine phosphoribosyltransferase [Nanchangia anserum]QOX82499.1 adenine phosphoribosyltransferase [Nanchangia anserum]
MTASTPAPVTELVALPSELGELVTSHMREIPDFPTLGVLFRDISPLFAAGEDFARFIRMLAAHYRGRIDAIAGLESRGFPLAAPLAVELGLPMIMIRKAGKLPGPVLREDYELEYATASMEIQPFTVAEDQRVLIVDDVLATGGTANASINLIERSGGIAQEFLVLMELTDLGGRARLPERVACQALLTL